MPEGTYSYSALEFIPWLTIMVFKETEHLSKPQKAFEEPFAADCADSVDYGLENNQNNPRNLRQNYEFFFC